MPEELRQLKRHRDYVIIDAVLGELIICPIRNAKCKATCAFYFEYIRKPVLSSPVRKRIVKCNYTKTDIGEI
jgi:hypothetical protein